MTLQTQKVLTALLDDVDGEHYGLELCKRAGLPSGTIYPILARLEQAGWLESEWEEIDASHEGRPPRRYYRLTGEGARGARREHEAAARSLGLSTEPGLAVT